MKNQPHFSTKASSQLFIVGGRQVGVEWERGWQAGWYGMGKGVAGRLVWKSGGRQVGVEEWGETGWCRRVGGDRLVSKSGEKAGWCGRVGRQVGVEQWGRQVGVEEWGEGRLVWKSGEKAGWCGRMGGDRLVWKSGGRQVGVEEWGEGRLVWKSGEKAGWCGRMGGDRLVWKSGGRQAGGSMQMHINMNCHQAHTCTVHQHKRNQVD